MHMSERYDLSRDLAGDEVPSVPSEAHDAARPVHRKPVASGGRATASEEKPGTEERPESEPRRNERPDVKAPPLESSSE
jgi:hypothetical protein